MSIENLFSGIIGAVGAVFLTNIYLFYKETRKYKEIKKSILSYHNITVLPKLIIYIENCKNAADEIKHAYTIVNTNRIYEMMPMLTKDFYMSYSSHEIYKAFGGEVGFISVVEIYHTIDFLKENMPLRLVNEFTQKLDLHMKAEGILNNKQQHFGECPYCKDQATRYIRNIQLKIETAKVLIQDISKLN